MSTKRVLSKRKAIVTDHVSSSHAASTDRLEDSSHTASYHLPSRVLEQRQRLLSWYDDVKNSRGMPWRRPYDASLSKKQRAQRAYEVWVSEIMLQQTQVATVIPYYQRWLSEFPTLSALARSDIETVNSVWKGLGYYRRAKLLFEGAQRVYKDFDGMLPEDHLKMQKDVPGVGRYTAGAIASIAYNARAPAVDGNVHRLLSRLLALHGSPKSKLTLDVLWKAATDLVEASDRPGDWNQALIELGSTVCKPRDPKCETCPLREACTAYLESKALKAPAITDIEDACALCEPFPAGTSLEVTRYPMKVERKKARQESSAVNVVEWKGPEGSWFLLARRPDKGLLGGLWEFPTLDLPATSPTSGTLLESHQTLLPTLLDDVPSKDSEATALRYAQDVRLIGDVLHIFSHIRKTYHALWVVLEGGAEPPSLARAQGGVAKKRKVSESMVEGATKWVCEEDVDGSTIGQGLVKVWDLVQVARSGKPLPKSKTVVRKTKVPVKKRKRAAETDDETDDAEEDDSDDDYP